MTPISEILFDAIQECDPVAVRRALTQGAAVNAKAHFGLTPLHVACRIHGLKAQRQLCHSLSTALIIQILLEAGADVTARDNVSGKMGIGESASGHMPAAWCEGETPECLRLRMWELASANVWPTADPDKKEGNPLVSGSKGSFVARGMMRRRNRPKVAA